MAYIFSEKSPYKLTIIFWINKVKPIKQKPEL